MADTPRTEHRIVRSADPALSAEANRLLTAEVRRVIGKDEVDVPIDRPDPATAAQRLHSPAIADIIGARLGAVFTALAALCVAAIIALVIDTTAILVVALVVLVVATLLALRSVWGLTDEREHPDPETAALLEGEGIGDPDRLLQDLVDEFREEPGPRRA
jgi:hypothetical protein